ncbi:MULTISPECIES: hypothetical protein [unclassified Marinobacter]|uniref:hypothetical protein n=1 Tax=unclassified Marinobacter TaxID=83889 RepID=UPI00192709FC|nr:MULTISPECIES: hypothetical protein [unclassified Marinobacter]MBL3825115.1 hypothetical protein [Marinobacter sp. MC3]MBL3893681.1 hypothetical protein [Marinobacter sp. MW3]
MSERLEILRTLRDYFSDRADAEYFTGSPSPVSNEEMRMLALVEELEKGESARAQQSVEGREAAISFVLGNTYQTVSGERVRFVKVHNEGTSYETMEDESGVNRYTNRAGDMGRVTARPVDYPGNVPPMYTHPPKAQGVPERLVELAEEAITDAAAEAQEGGSYEPVEWANLVVSMLSTIPPADKPEGEWVKPEDRLPEDESTRLALVNDYDEPMVVPVRYFAGSEQWFDVENVDVAGDQHTLYEVVLWRDLPAAPDMGGEK